MLHGIGLSSQEIYQHGVITNEPSYQHAGQHGGYPAMLLVLADPADAFGRRVDIIRCLGALGTALSG